MSLDPRAGKDDRMAVRRGDDKAWDEFVSWCRGRGLQAVPAHPWTLAAYARWSERHYRYPAIAKSMRAITRVHNSKSRKRPDRNPMVKRTLRLIESRAKMKKDKNAPKPLFPEDEILAPVPPVKKAAKKTGKKNKEGKGGKKSRPGLSPTPKLVSRRRLKK